MPQRVPFGCLALAVIMGMLVIFPLLLADLALHALAKLGLTGPVSLLVILGVLFGGFINIPVKKIPREEKIQVPRIALFGIGQFLPSLVTRRTYTIIAINFGGCIIPTGIAFYELWRLGIEGTGPLLIGLLAVAINIVVCYYASRPVPNVGIAMRPFIPAIIAALCGILLLPQLAPPVACAAGVLGPLIGADLFHLKDIGGVRTGVASIGGAGTFDGIVLSGFIATLLA